MSLRQCIAGRKLTFQDGMLAGALSVFIIALIGMALSLAETQPPERQPTEFFISVGYPMYGHEMIATAPAFGVGIVRSPYRLSIEDLGQAIIMKDTIQLRHIRGIRAGLEKNHIEGGLFAYQDAAPERYYAIAPYIGIFSDQPRWRISFDYSHSMRDEMSSSHVWMLAWKFKL